jgi:taurine--2-oxoglutarate transaminase
MAIDVAPATMSAEEIVALCRRHSLYEWSAQSTVDPIPVDHARGVYFYTPDGRRFIDFNSQLMSVNIGHGDRRVIDAITQQATRLQYVQPAFATEIRGRLGKKLAEILPGDLDKVFFTLGGAEAIENAIKLARHVTGRYKVLARYRAYHGATMGAMTLTGDPRRWAN